MIKLIVFDWDDVITLGAKEGYFACYRKAINKVGVYLSDEEEEKRINAKWGSTFREEIKELLQESPELVDEACKYFEEEYWGDTFAKSLTLVDGINDLLLRLKDKYKLGVASGNHHKMLAERIIPYFKIPNVFSEIISSHQLDDPTKGKPNPFMIEFIMNRLGILPSETVFVGDASNDVLMARSAGVTPIVVLTGQLSREKAEEMGVEYIIDNVTKIESILKLL